FAGAAQVAGTADRARLRNLLQLPPGRAHLLADFLEERPDVLSVIGPRRLDAALQLEEANRLQMLLDRLRDAREALELGVERRERIRGRSHARDDRRDEHPQPRR